MPGLSNSRWASNDGRASSVPPSPTHRFSEGGGGVSESTVISRRDPHRPETAAAELERYSKIVRRMKWKLPFLDHAYRQATSGDDGTTNATEAVEAELMFKLDFFEYYMLCERALVHLQGVFGISISREFAPGIRMPIFGGDPGRGRHRYHANVLEALDREDNPLHTTLGVGEVRRQLALAKDLRNRWKNADNDCTGTRISTTAARGAKLYTAPLATYDLVGILTTIHEGLDHAFAIASHFVSNQEMGTGGGGRGMQHNPSLMDMDVDTANEKEWGFMIEAMDWEAV